MKKSVKIISVLLAALLAGSAVGCGGNRKIGAEGKAGYEYAMDMIGCPEPSEACGLPLDTGMMTAGGEISEEYREWLDANMGKIIENPFINTADEPVSTFSADVDTASYTYFRKMVNMGYTFDEIRAYAGSGMRTEEMINYFNYDLPMPEGDDLFGMKAEVAACPWNDGAMLLTLSLATEKAETSMKNNLVFLIDVSGSMASDDKLGLLKKSFGYLTSMLDGDDRVSIVTYSGKEEVLLEGCSGAKTDKIMRAVNSLSAGGSTNGEAGLKKAYDIAKKNYVDGGNNRIIMASDGDLNVGISSLDALTDFVTDMRESGVYLTTLGFGTGNYRDANMETLADNGNGSYHYIDCEAEAEKVFGSDLCSTLYTVASDVKLQLTFSADTVERYRLVGYENRVMDNADFNDDTKDAGELGAGHAVTVCYEIVPKLSPSSLAYKLCNLSVRYKKPGESTAVQDDYTIGSESVTGTPSCDFRFICLVTELSMLLHSSENIGNITLSDVASGLDALRLSGALGDEYKRALVDLVDTLVERGGTADTKGLPGLKTDGIEKIIVTSMPEGYHYEFDTDESIASLVGYFASLPLISDYPENPDEYGGMTWSVTLEYKDGSSQTVYHFGNMFVRLEGGQWYKMVYADAERLYGIIQAANGVHGSIG